jgi:hypothetical protein
MIVFSIYKTAQKSRFAPTADAISAFEKTGFFEVFPMFVPSLSWQKDALNV